MTREKADVTDLGSQQSGWLTLMTENSHFLLRNSTKNYFIPCPSGLESILPQCQVHENTQISSFMGVTRIMPDQNKLCPFWPCVPAHEYAGLLWLAENNKISNSLFSLSKRFSSLWLSWPCFFFKSALFSYEMNTHSVFNGYYEK